MSPRKNSTTIDLADSMINYGHAKAINEAIRNAFEEPFAAPTQGESEALKDYLSSAQKFGASIEEASEAMNQLKQAIMAGHVKIHLGKPPRDAVPRTPRKRDFLADDDLDLSDVLPEA